MKRGQLLALLVLASILVARALGIRSVSVLVVVLGPTAVGKSRVAVDLALRFGGEIVSGDSIQVYRGFDIGTDKPDVAARRSVPHHLIPTAVPDCLQLFPAHIVQQRSAEDLLHQLPIYRVLPGGDTVRLFVL